MKKVLYLIVALALLLSFSMVNAQDITAPAPSEPTPTLGSIEITVTPGGEPVLPPVQPPVDGITVSLGTLLFLLGMTILAGLGAGAGIGSIVFQYLGRKDVRDTMEKLFLSASPETQRVILEQLGYARDTVEKLLKIITDVTDGQPNQDVIVAQIVAQVREDLRHDDRKMWNIEQAKTTGG